MSESKQPDLYVIYAEEVRQEANHRATIVGWIQDGLITKPKDSDLVVPRMSMLCVLRLPLEPRPKRLVNRLRFEGRDIAIHDISEVLDRQTRGELGIAEMEKSQERLEISYVIGTTNRVFSQPGLLSVVVDVDGAPIKGNGLKIVEAI